MNSETAKSIVFGPAEHNTAVQQGSKQPHAPAEHNALQHCSTAANGYTRMRADGRKQERFTFAAFAPSVLAAPLGTETASAAPTVSSGSASGSATCVLTGTTNREAGRGIKSESRAAAARGGVDRRWRYSVDGRSEGHLDGRSLCTHARGRCTPGPAAGVVLHASVSDSVVGTAKVATGVNQRQTRTAFTLITAPISGWPSITSTIPEISMSALRTSWLPDITSTCAHVVAHHAMQFNELISGATTTCVFNCCCYLLLGTPKHTRACVHACVREKQKSKAGMQSMGEAWETRRDMYVCAHVVPVPCQLRPALNAFAHLTAAGVGWVVCA